MLRQILHSFSLYIVGSLVLVSPGLTGQSLDDVTIYTDNKLLISSLETERDQSVSTAVDTVILMLEELQYTGQLTYTSLPRALKMMDSGEPACVVNKVRNSKRNREYAISLPLNFFESVRLYQLAVLPPLVRDLLDANNKVRSLRQVIARFPDTAIMLPSHFSFGSELDEEIAEIDPRQIVRLQADRYFESYQDLFLKRNVGFALMFPFTHQHVAQRSPSDAVREYKLATVSDHISGHILCADTATGRRAINTFNQAIESLYRNPAFLDVHLAYLPEATHASFERLLSRLVTTTNERH
ncbi:hypothetical protein [Alteromonas halophila]|uniref:Uncharacterized protein n=1 Tax=Alteromonas halophila TaxID=516698 RepID=A0A918JPV2_9ALTE|nr:hypothetical protein [Alteromonas halophila]GGW95936.1 hypothetical protein GCM10007391_32660 [Alteromonas halophila]